MTEIVDVIESREVRRPLLQERRDSEEIDVSRITPIATSGSEDLPVDEKSPTRKGMKPKTVRTIVYIFRDERIYSPIMIYFHSCRT